MKCPIYHKWLLLLFLLPLFLFCPNVNAETISGASTYYYQYTSNGSLPTGYSGTYSGISYPTTSYTQLSAYSNNSYQVITQLDLQVNSIEIRTGNTYNFVWNFDMGSYVYPGWPNTQSSSAFAISSCPGGTCTATYSYSIDSTHQSVNTFSYRLTYKATSNRSGVTFAINNSTSTTGLFYNAYSSQQGIRINSASVTVTEDPNYQNTQDIINNNNQNTQTIINNQNENTEKEIESQKVCSYIDSNSIVTDNYLLRDWGSLVASNFYGVTDYIDIYGAELSIATVFNYEVNSSICYYNISKSLISCQSQANLTELTIPSGTYYIRASIFKSENKPTYKLCKNGNQALNDTLTDSNINVGAETSSIFDSFDFFDDDTLSGIITLPLQIFNALNSDTCSPITLTLFGQNVVLPCGTTIFWGLNNQYVINFRAFWNLLFFGLIIYRLSVQLYINVSNVLDPTKDSLGVFKL